MPKVNAHERLRLRIISPMLLTLLPLIVSFILWIVGAIRADTLSETAQGAIVATLGGILTGSVADRFIRRKRGDLELIVGLALTTAIGVLTIGYLYLIHIQGPMSSIGEIDRATEQITVFLTYLFAQILGIQIIKWTITDPKNTEQSTATSVTE